MEWPLGKEIKKNRFRGIKMKIGKDKRGEITKKNTREKGLKVHLLGY